MNGIHGRIALLLFSAFLFLSFSSLVYAEKLFKGIYITQTTLEDTKKLNYLIDNAKKSGIMAFVVDMDIPSKLYEKNINLLRANNIQYIARVVIFPNGGNSRGEVMSQAHWEKKYRLIKTAIGYGASEIQLDYIRYSPKQKPSQQNAHDIYQIINWYKKKLSEAKIPLQIDVFGISSFGESKYIGQNIRLFSSTIDALCPMVYPSHYRPFAIHFATPFKTIYTSLESIKKQFGAEGKKKLPFKLYPYIELSNYHYPLSGDKKLAYIYAQIQAVEAAGADGWFAWSAHNVYDNLFKVLQTKQVK